MTGFAFMLLGVISSPAADALPRAPAASESRIVEQANAPVLITSYRTDYQKRTNDAAEGLRHDLEYRSRSDQRIVAVQFGLVAFDVWNEFLDRTAALSSASLSPRGRDRNSWYTSTGAAVAFYTGIAYVERVRFESGEIWTADLDAVVTAMRAVEKDFNPEHLSKKASSR